MCMNSLSFSNRCNNSSLQWWKWQCGKWCKCGWRLVEVRHDHRRRNTCCLAWVHHWYVYLRLFVNLIKQLLYRDTANGLFDRAIHLHKLKHICFNQTITLHWLDQHICFEICLCHFTRLQKLKPLSHDIT